MVNIEMARNYCLSKKGVTEGMPFGEGVLVFKVMSKMFALLSLDGDHSMNLKCDPEYALELRDGYDFVLPGYHMNKKHWNTIQFTPEIPVDFLKELIDHSYALVVAKLTKAEKKLLEE